MKSYFTIAPFERNGVFLPPRRMAGWATPRPPARMGDFFSDLASGLTGDVAGIQSSLDNMIKSLPPDLVTNFQTQRAQCMTQSGIAQYTCLYNLFQSVQKELSNRNISVNTPYIPPPPDMTWPILIGGLLLLGGGAYFLIKKRKKGAKPKK